MQDAATVAQLAQLTIELCWKRTRSEEVQSRIATEIVVRLGGATPVKDIDQRMICERLLDPWRRAGAASTTINRKRAVWRRMMTVALERCWIDTIPSWPAERLRVLPSGKKEGQRERWLTREELASILPRLPHDYRCFCYFLLYTGMRVSEALAVCPQDIDLDRRVIHIRRSKSGRGRIVPLVQGALDALELRHPSLPCFHYINQSQLNHLWRHARQEAGLDDPDVVPHTLRHTYATRLLQQGLSIVTLSRLLGHSKLATTMRYAQHSQEEIDRARDLMEDQ